MVDAVKRPESLARKGEGRMDEDDFKSIVQSALSQSAQYVDSELSQDRATATEYYLGKPFGNEEEGRSQVVLTEVRDAVDGMLPSLLRVFFGSEHTVEFVPTKAETVPMAEQMTDYVRYVFEEDNAGFLRTMDVLKDGLVRKLGIFKWGWDNSVDTKAYRQEGITDAELKMLAADDDVEVLHVEKVPATKEAKAEHAAAVEHAKQTPPQPGQPVPSVPPIEQLYNVDLNRTIKGGRARVWSVPPEEFIFNRQCRELDGSLLCGHRTEKSRGQLIALGVSESDLDEYAGADGDSGSALQMNAEEIARRDVQGVGQLLGSGFQRDPELGHANDKILYTEAWMTIDYDGDGIAELRRICCIGTQYVPVSNDPTDERPFSIFTPYPEPHTLIGGSVADRTMDVQKINSSVLRGILDSAALAIFPRMAYLDGQASVADIMNTAIGAPMRERVTGAIRPVVTPFTGKEMLPVLSFMQEVIERRTGRNKGAAGLDADALQSTGKGAVDAVLSGSQEQIEMLARVFAEGTLKPLMKGLGRLLSTHQPRSRMVRLRGQWTDVDPRGWDNDMDVTVNIALGSTFTDKKIGTLMSVAADQKDMLMSAGPMAALVTIPMLRNTRAKILALQGLKDADSYYVSLPPNWQPPAPAPQPSPEMLAMQAEKDMNQAKIVKELAIKQDELALKAKDQEWQHEFLIQKLAAETSMKKYAADAQFHSTMTQAQLNANIESEAREAELSMQGHDMLHDQMLARDDQAHSQSMDQQSADTDAAAQQADAQPEQEPMAPVEPPAPPKKRKSRITKQPDGSFEIEHDV